MTTIAWDGDILAVDSQITEGDTIVDNDCQKIWKEVAGFKAVTACGDWASIQDLILLVQDAAPKDLLKTRAGFSEITLVGLAKNGRLFQYHWNPKGEVYQCEVRYPSAWGSGYAYALSALDFGKTSREAVKYASTRDLYTNNNIKTVRK